MSAIIYTLHRDKVFAALTLKINCYFYPSNSVVWDTLQNTDLYKVLNRISAVHRSTFLHSFPSLELASFCTNVTWELRFSLQLSMCRWNPIYKMVSPYKSASCTASLALHLNFYTGTSKQSFGDFSIENPQQTFFFLLVLLCNMCALTTMRSNIWKKRFFHNFIVILSNE